MLSQSEKKLGTRFKHRSLNDEQLKKLIQHQKLNIMPNESKLEKSLEFVKEIDEENCTKTRAREYELKVNDDDNN